MLGIIVGANEDVTFWSAFLSLRKLGLSGMQLVLSNARAELRMPLRAGARTAAGSAAACT